MLYAKYTKHEKEENFSSLKKVKRKNPFLKSLKKDYQLYLLALPAIIYFILFHYWPMYGVQIAFKDFIAVKGITGSPWVGFKHFERFFKSFQFWRLMKNTIGVSLYQLIAGFPIPIIMALLLNQTKNKRFKNSTNCYLCTSLYFSSCFNRNVYIFLSPRNGIINQFLSLFGIDSIFFLGDPKYLKVYLCGLVWQNAGWGSIIYLAALSGINPELYEAAKVDGATKLRTIWHIDIPGIMPTAVILLIMNVGKIMNVGFQKHTYFKTH